MQTGAIVTGLCCAQAWGGGGWGGGGGRPPEMMCHQLVIELKSLHGKEYMFVTINLVKR